MVFKVNTYNLNKDTLFLYRISEWYAMEKSQVIENLVSFHFGHLQQCRNSKTKCYVSGSIKYIFKILRWTINYKLQKTKGRHFRHTKVKSV